MKVALGIITYNRPEYAEKCVKAIASHLTGVVDSFYLINDGSDAKYTGAYKRAYKAFHRIHGIVLEQLDNRGVATAKNVLLQTMLDNTKADWLFVCEDDIIVKSHKAITGYIEACQQSGFDHLAFAHHGPANVGPSVLDSEETGVSLWPHSVGAWCVYSRKCLEDVGLFDEQMVNAFEHVEHSLRLALAEWTTGPYRWADATDSRNWLAEIPGSIEKSSIRPRDDWSANIRNSLTYWQNCRPETFEVMFGPGTQLYGWAARIIG